MTVNKLGTLWLIGAGNMGGALLQRWAAEQLFTRLVAIDPNAAAMPQATEHHETLQDADGTPDYVVLAVKPNLAASAVCGLLEKIGPQTVVISIMAGLPLSALRRLLPDAKLVRAMPNTPAAAGRGVTGLHSESLNGEARQQVGRIFDAAGFTHWLQEEQDFDVLTAVSGSGPAYVFRMVEALAAAAEGAGLNPDLAQRLARETVVGAGALLERDERTATDLRRAVTSPGGTTEAGLEALDGEPGLPALCVLHAAAAQRSRRPWLVCRRPYWKLRSRVC